MDEDGNVRTSALIIGVVVTLVLLALGTFVIEPLLPRFRFLSYLPASAFVAISIEVHRRRAAHNARDNHRPLPRRRRSAAASGCAACTSGGVLPWRLDRWQPPGDRSDITAVLDWEAAHLGDPLRELARAAWGSSLDDERSADALIEGYGADPGAVRAWFPVHAAELWLWFTEAGPPEYLERLKTHLEEWP